MKTSAVQRKATIKYLASERGKAWYKEYVKSDTFKRTQKRYHQSEKYKKLVREHPEIYRAPTFKNSVARLLVWQDEQIKGDPESLTSEFICTMLEKPMVKL